tara:strand:- start:100 stop:318 length:219 start_codon:yes stop_codon:yes gene_type:complete
MTEYINKSDKIETSDKVIEWIKTELKIKKKPIRVELNIDRTIARIKIGTSLTQAQKKKLTDKFTELQGKEIG